MLTLLICWQEANTKDNMISLTTVAPASDSQFYLPAHPRANLGNFHLRHVGALWQCLDCSHALACIPAKKGLSCRCSSGWICPPDRGLHSIQGQGCPPKPGRPNACLGGQTPKASASAFNLEKVSLFLIDRKKISPKLSCISVGWPCQPRTMPEVCSGNTQLSRYLQLTCGCTQ